MHSDILTSLTDVPNLSVPYVTENCRMIMKCLWLIFGADSKFRLESVESSIAMRGARVEILLRIPIPRIPGIPSTLLRADTRQAHRGSGHKDEGRHGGARSTLSERYELHFDLFVCRGNVRAERDMQHQPSGLNRKAIDWPRMALHSTTSITALRACERMAYLSTPGACAGKLRSRAVAKT